GSTRRYPETIDRSTLPELQAAAKSLLERAGGHVVSAAEAQAWFGDGTRTTYLLDVRTPEEYAAGSLPGAVHAPGGQLIQATDQWIGIRNARVVLIDDGEMIRAPVVASWLRQLGCQACALEGGVRARVAAPAPARFTPPALPTIAPVALRPRLDGGTVRVLDLAPSMAYRQAHIPGAFWSTRPRIVRDAAAG